MLTRTAKPAFLAPVLDSGCVPAALDPTLVAVDFTPSMTALEGVFRVPSLGPASARFAWTWALAAPLLLVKGSELVCALVGRT
jgi:hypothetical protein